MIFKGWNRKEKHMCLMRFQFGAKCYDIGRYYHAETDKWYCYIHYPPHVAARQEMKKINYIAREARKVIAKAEKRKKTHKIHLLVSSDIDRLIMGCGNFIGTYLNKHTTNKDEVTCTKCLTYIKNGEYKGKID